MPFAAGTASSPQLQLIADRGDDANGVLETLPEVVVRPPAKQPVGETKMESVGGAFFGRLAFEVADTIADSIPFVGQAKGLGELWTGENALGEDIGILGRIGGAANLIPGGKKITQAAGAVGGGLKKIFGALSGIGKKADNAADGVARMGKAARKTADAVDDVVPRVKFPGNDATRVPDGFEWRGKPGSVPGSKDGNYYNPKTGESLRPDLNHPGPIGPHWDHRDSAGKWWRIFPDGSVEPK